MTVELLNQLEIAPEDRCTPYDSDNYPYRRSVEPEIVKSMGGIVYGPYTGTWFDDITQTDIEHIVARSEAHDSGLCAADAGTQREFASDLINLTLASPSVNRHQKSDNDMAEWVPFLNRCWYASRIVEVKAAYSLTVDRDEYDALKDILSGCASTEMIITDPSYAPTPTSVPSEETPTPDNALELYDSNGNGRITCAEAREHGIAPVHKDHPAYQYMNDRDGDGIVCE